MIHESASNEWAMIDREKTYSALTLATLQEWARDRKVLSSTMIYRPGAAAWQRASEIPELSGIVYAAFASSVCRACGNRGEPVFRSKANGCVAVALLFFFIVPGIIYLIWAATTESDRVCPYCQSVNTMIPVNSPFAR